MKKGFTLIELLAVIVILAIIALIAVPIILEIINDAREESNKRSVELYANAVRNGIAAHQLRTGNEVLPGTYNKDNKLPFEVEYDGDVDCTSIIISDDSKVSLLGCTVNDSEKQYSYGTKQGSSIEVGKMSICNPLKVQTEGVYTPGDKYECDVDPNKQGYDQIFYVLNSNATSVNLIMDSNIRKNGEAVKEANPTEEQKGLVEWVNEEDYGTLYPYDGDICYEENGCAMADKGPITAMNHLQTATAGWTNTKELTINTFTDEGGNTHNMTEYKVNARMPYYSEVGDSNGTNTFLYEHLDGSEWNGYGTRTNVVSGVNGYWTLSGSFDCANIVEHDGYFTSGYVGDNYYGVRPVINLSI